MNVGCHFTAAKLIISDMNSVSTLLFIIMSVVVAVITDNNVVFMCGGKGVVFQNITKLGRKKANNSVRNNPAKFELTSRTAMCM